MMAENRIVAIKMAKTGKVRYLFLLMLLAVLFFN